MINKNQVKRIFADVAPDVNMAYKRYCEKKKYKDGKRVSIANQYPLTAEQKEQIDELYITNYGEQIGYVWHQNFAAHAGKFDYRFFPELLFVPEFEAFENQNLSASTMLGDKNFLPLIAQASGVRMPHTIFSCTNGMLRDGENKAITPEMAKELIKRQCGCFIKPTVDSCSGEGCAIIKENDKVDVLYNSLIINQMHRGGGVS